MGSVPMNTVGYDTPEEYLRNHVQASKSESETGNTLFILDNDTFQ